MKNIHAIWRREFSAFFQVPAGYATLALFLVAVGGTFVLSALRNEGGTTRPAELLFGAMAVWLTVLIPLVCMRTFAEERRYETLETLLTAPVTEREVVLGKYAGALTFTLLAVTLAVAHLFVLVMFSPGLGRADVDAAVVLSGWLQAALLSALLVAACVWVSLLTASQIAATLLGFCLIWLIVLGGWLLSQAPGVPMRLADHLSVTAHIEDFSRGMVDTRPILLCLSGTCFFLFVAVRALETKRWL